MAAILGDVFHPPLSSFYSSGGHNSETQTVAIGSHSKLGEWLHTQEQLPIVSASGMNFIQIVCSGFSVGCLETLEEIAWQSKKAFFEAGGEPFEYIPALNNEPFHIELFKQLVMENSRQ